VDGILGQAAIFHGVAPATVSDLTRELRSVDLAPGDVIFSEGDPGSSMYIIKSGKVKLGCRASDGRQKLFTTLGPSEMFGEISTCDPGIRTCTATAMTHVQAAVVQRDILLSWIAQYPEIGHRLMRILARRLRRTTQEQSDLMFTDVAGRVAKQLLRLAQQFGVQDSGVMRVTHDLTQEELAQLVGATRETVNKALGDFSARGWITLQGKTVLIADSERLASRARDAAVVDTDHISEAKRLIMERFDIDAARAFTLLTNLSRDSNTPISEIAANIVADGAASSIVNPPSHLRANERGHFLSSAERGMSR
jgi:CRP/FNR family cyclic AMP-dependent transcriptional regulator